MGTLTEQLLRAGLISPKQAEREQMQKERRARKPARTAGADDRGPSFPSIREFLLYARGRLMSDGYTPQLMKALIAHGHRVAEDLHAKEAQRGRMHKLLSRVAERLQGLTPEERTAFLNDALVAFQNVEPKLL